MKQVFDYDEASKAIICRDGLLSDGWLSFTGKDEEE